MLLANEEKMSFITEKRTYCYKVMPFNLKNAGATYQRMMDKVFKHQLDMIMEGYVDDMFVKSMTFEQHLRDLREVFKVLESHNMKLNPFKCVFAIQGRKFLGFLVSNRGIEPNLENIQTLLNMTPPMTVKEVQHLIERLAVLNRFIAKLGERSLLFFKILRNTPNFQWTYKCQKSFKELKVYLSFPIIFSQPNEGKTLLLYLGVATGLSVQCWSGKKSSILCRQDTPRFRNPLLKSRKDCLNTSDNLQKVEGFTSKHIKWWC
jgi:hypothetical protein